MGHLNADWGIYTDDEFLAMRVLLGVSLPVALPTVDVTDEASVRSAIVRGHRSLIARDVMAGEELPEELASLVRSGASESGTVIYLGKQDGTLASFESFGKFTLGLRGEWVWHRLNAAGLHSFSAVEHPSKVIRLALESAMALEGQGGLLLWVVVRQEDQGLRGVGCRGATTQYVGGEPARSDADIEQMLAYLSGSGSPRGAEEADR